MQDLKITVVQSSIAWENPEANYKNYEALLSGLQEDTDLVVLPEMFSTGFSMSSARLAEKMEGKTLSWMATMAEKLSAVITGSLVIEDNDAYYNRMIWMMPDGRMQYYDKKHLFRMAGENKCYQPGVISPIFSLNGWKIKPFICYDLRFPVWCRNRFSAEKGYSYDLALFVANWPEARKDPWVSLLKARAIENLAYVAGVNRVGVDGNGISYSGNSAVFCYKGTELSSITEHEETIQQLNLSFSELHAFRNSFPAGQDADNFELR